MPCGLVTDNFPEIIPFTISYANFIRSKVYPGCYYTYTFGTKSLHKHQRCFRNPDSVLVHAPARPFVNRSDPLFFGTRKFVL
jgi:hypothetical protein